MIFHRGRNRIAGFNAEAPPNSNGPFLELGEIWAASDWTIHWHQNEGWEIYFQSQGASRWQLADGSIHGLQENGFYVIAPGLMHRLVEFQGETVHFHYAVIPAERIPPHLREKSAWRTPCAFGQNAEALALPFKGLIREITSERPWQMVVCAQLVSILCHEVTRITERTPAPRNLEAHPAALQAEELMQRRLDYPWQVSELAGICGLSTAHFIEVFRAEFGETPKQHLLRLRIEEAARRLQDSDQTITQIAHDLSFSSSQHFARTFRQFKGLSARQFRGSQQEGLSER